MKPFKIKYPLQKLVEHYPDPQLLRRVVLEGGEEPRGVIARLWLSEGIPYAFRTCPAIYDTIRCWVGECLEVHPKEISLVGSARLGKSIAPNPKKFGKPYINNKSDLDLFIISGNLFERLKEDFLNWRCDFESKRIYPGEGELMHHWEENYERVPKNIKRGFITAHMVPARPVYPTAQKIQETMEHLVKRLKNTCNSPHPERASIRCYDSWDSFVQQNLLNLKELAEMKLESNSNILKSLI